MSDHLRVEHHGSIVLLTPLSDAAVQWFAAHVGAPDAGGTYYCEPRFVGDIVHGCARAVLDWH